MKLYPLFFISLLLFSLGACEFTKNQKPSEKQSKHEAGHKKNPPKKQKKEVLLMEEYEEMKHDLESQGYVVTTDSANYIYLDNSVKMKFN